MTRVPSSRAVVACAAVLILAAHASAHAFTQTQARDLPITPTLATVNPHVLLGAATLTVTGLLCPLYFYRRRLYILYWIAGWSLATAATFLVARDYPNRKLGAALTASHSFWASSARSSSSSAPTPTGRGPGCGAATGLCCCPC